MPTPRDYGTFRERQRASAHALNNHADRLRELDGVAPVGQTTIPGVGTTGRFGRPYFTGSMPVEPVQIIAPRTDAPGKYDVRIFRGGYATTVTSSAALTESDLGDGTTVNGIGYFAPDIAAGTHGLAEDAVLAGVVVGEASVAGDPSGPLVLLLGGGGGGEEMPLPTAEGQVPQATGIGEWLWQFPRFPPAS